MCHAQIRLRDELQETIEELNQIRTLKFSKLLSGEGGKRMKVLEKQKSIWEKKLIRLEQGRVAQAKVRKTRKLKLKRLMEKHPSVAQEYNLALHDQSGQPRVEERGQSALLGSYGLEQSMFHYFTLLSIISRCYYRNCKSWCCS